MNKSYSLLALVCALAAGNVLAQNAPAAQTPVVQAAVRNPVAPIMSHEVATLIKFTHQAQAQYRRSGSPQDLARVKAMQTELASRGFGRTTQDAPAMGVDVQLAGNMTGNSQFMTSVAQ
ncbi:hypothetical protein [Rhodoferax sp.]|uniref:hypothetical protein n=1 Tax=Rhodoferax sp. TaxID=50421 RepID=UPI0008B1C4A7|nr:hypothetical protein [Rhodoferax sp.]MDO8320733.1 hypothetical protein [Rhodoferax sp.]MDP2677632.1 hypothetical protein [Rhodoferax sp.]OGB39757.1 MAG: hypothetical protein A2461_00850 [Burkholderiales bacterium RIFOXYC2_FULL_59_8]OGB50707.1 MAG: hypothetical protein A2503_09475 [Burkholderiales bacterium RIFOXYD12_FULL_59_19]